MALNWKCILISHTLFVLDISRNIKLLIIKCLDDEDGACNKHTEKRSAEYDTLNFREPKMFMII